MYVITVFLAMGEGEKGSEGSKSQAGWWCKLGYKTYGIFTPVFASAAGLRVSGRLGGCDQVVVGW